MLALQAIEGNDVLAIRRSQHVDDMVSNLLVQDVPLSGLSKAGSLHASTQVSAGFVQEKSYMCNMVFRKLLAKVARNPVLVDEGGNVSSYLLDVGVPHLDVVVEDADVSIQGSTSRSTVCCRGSLSEASVKHSESLGFVNCLGDVEQAGGRGTPFGAQEVQRTLGTPADGRVGALALVFLHPHFSAHQVARQIRPHIQVHVAAAQIVGEIELVLVGKNEALLPEQLDELGEAGMVLIKI